MLTLDQSHKEAADLYRLAYLLTGKRGASVDVMLEAIGYDGPSDSFFANWMVAWSRRVVIAKALAVVRGELAASAGRTISWKCRKPDLPPRSWTNDHDTTSVQLERALLSIDVFPRCALLLTVFEGMPVQDVSVLLDASPELVKKGQAIGLGELTVNLARLQGWTSDAPESFVITGEMQHA
jgi:DNA-directed RNA polymerase specialized sigma24 family protein